MKNIIQKNKSEIMLFASIALIYIALSSIFFTQTTIFYDTNNVSDVLLDTDTGVLINWNIFATAQDNSKHILFLQIVSIIAYPIYLISIWTSKLFNVEFIDVYGLGLITLQIVISSISITMIYNHIKILNIKKETRFLIILIMISSFSQIFMTLNVERFIYGQLSLVAFLIIISKIKNQESYLIDIAAIPLFGITLTNIYLYGINLLLQFKLNIKKIVKHLGVFTLISYLLIISTRAYNSLFMVGNTIQYDTKFIQVIPIIDKIKMTIMRLIYPTLYFPAAKYQNGMYLQGGSTNLIFTMLILIVLVAAIIGGIKNYKKRIPQLCLSIIGFNLLLHGVIGYNLKNANIMTIHFTFAIIILLAYLAKSLPKKHIKIYNVFLMIILITVIISNMQGFREILAIGLQYYPK